MLHGAGKRGPTGGQGAPHLREPLGQARPCRNRPHSPEASWEERVPGWVGWGLPQR